MTPVDWLWLLHPALAVALVYPLLGAALQLALQTRRRRLNQAKAPVSSGTEHTALGRWLTAAVVTIQLIAYAVVILTKQPSQLDPGRSGLLLLVLAGSVLALAALWRVRQPLYRASFWGGMGLTGLLLFSLAAQPEIQRQLRWRRLHLSANALAALIFITQGITGPRDLLEIPLSWQKPTIYGCNFEQRICPPFAPAPAPQPPG
jgi:hypothetical protein